MTESTVQRYKKLFEVRLLHHYWLDEGATPVDLIADEKKRARRIAAYDHRAFLSARPTEPTARLLKGLGCLFRETPLGFVVAAPDTMTMAVDTVLSFALVPETANFFDYTAMTMRPHRIHEIFDPATERLYRFKDSVPVLSNLTGAKRGAGADAKLFLSRSIPSPDPSHMVEALVVDNGALRQLTSDNPDATSRELAADASQFPIYLHQGDTLPLAPPPGLTGVPDRGIELTDAIPDDLFALVSLTAVRADDAAFSFVTGGGAPKATAPVYDMRFRNRSTVWTYLDRGSGAPVSTESDALPLTMFGNAGSKQKPTAGLTKAVLAGSKISRLVSEIFV